MPAHRRKNSRDAFLSIQGFYLSPMQIWIARLGDSKMKEDKQLRMIGVQRHEDVQREKAHFVVNYCQGDSILTAAIDKICVAKRGPLPSGC